jgi:hypothetical protein
MSLKKKVLIITSSLSIGGGEKLCYELALFCKKNGFEPIILVLNSKDKEHYDEVLQKIGARVIRVEIYNIRGLRNLKKIILALFWKYYLLNINEQYFHSTQVIGISLLTKLVTLGLIDSTKVKTWHITNKVQYGGSKLAFPAFHFCNPYNHFILINKYQKEEILADYESVYCKFTDFKIFVNQ